MVEYIQPIYENPAARFERRGSALICKKISVQTFSSKIPPSKNIGCPFSSL